MGWVPCWVQCGHFRIHTLPIGVNVSVYGSMSLCAAVMNCYLEYYLTTTDVLIPFILLDTDSDTLSLHISRYQPLIWYKCVQKQIYTCSNTLIGSSQTAERILRMARNVILYERLARKEMFCT